MKRNMLRYVTISNVLIIIILGSVIQINLTNEVKNSDQSDFYSSGIRYSQKLEKNNELEPQIMGIHKKWSTNLDFEIGFSSPLIADLNNDSVLEIVIGAEDGRIHVLNPSNGNDFWDSPDYGLSTSSPVMGDLNQDGFPEIIVGSQNGSVYYIDFRYGKTEKLFIRNDAISSSPAIADLDDDKFLEVIIGSGDGNVTCISNTGELKWFYETSGPIIYSSPAIADLDNDSSQEVIIGSYDNRIYCLNNLGGLKWSYATLGWILSSPAVADLDDDGTLEIVIGSFDTKVYCLNYKGESLWEYTTDEKITTSPAIADIDNDGDLEIIVGSYDGKIHCIDKTGLSEWIQPFSTNSSIYSSPSVADLDNDGTLEILIGSLNNSLYCLNHSGGLEWEYATNGAIFSSASIVDLNNDGLLEIVFGSQDKKVYCLELTGVTSSATHQWYCFRGSVFRTGRLDSDSDYLDDVTEDFYSSDKLNSDSDSDLLLDGEEILLYFTNPMDEDSDDDALSDYEEIMIYKTDPNNPDTDGDGKLDGEEIAINKDPLVWDNYGKLFGKQLIIAYLAILVIIVLALSISGRRINMKQKKRFSKINTLINDGHKDIKYDTIVDELDFENKRQFTSWVGKSKSKLPIDLEEHNVKLHEAMPVELKKKYTILIIETKTKDPKRALAFSRLISTIKKELSFAILRTKYEIKSAEAVEAADLTYHFMTHNPEIVHFHGHSSEDNKIILLKDVSKTVKIKPDDLAKLFKLFKESIRCVVLSSCYNEAQAEAIAEHIDCVVGTLKTTEDKSAVSFAQGFYRAILGGKNINEAFEFGEVQMKLTSNKGKPKLKALNVDPTELIFE